MKCILICKGVKPLMNGNRNAKDYPYWEELISLLLEEYKVIEVNEMPLKNLEELIKKCDIWIAVDSFFQHFAWSLGKKGIVIFSKSDPVIFGHPENINLLLDRKCLRDNQFDMWEGESHNKDVFVKPKVILQEIKKDSIIILIP